MSCEHEELTERLLRFRDERDWRQFHSLKNLLLSTSLEVSELVEVAQWMSDEAVEEAGREDPQFVARLAEECADVFLYLLLICERTGIDLTRAAHAKIDQNGRKYPVEKARGSARKYTELE